MSSPMRYSAALFFAVSFSLAVGSAQENRVLGHIDSARRVSLAGRVHRLARAANDMGRVESSFTLPAVTLMLKSSPSQQSALRQLVQEQQDPASPNFHKWLTPEQYADRFGVSQSDLNQITAWLQSQGFTIGEVARGRTWITFSGTAAQAQSALGTEIHRYNVNGETHYANATDPTVPAALSSLVAGFRGLHNFRLKPHLRQARPNLNSAGGRHNLAPDDFATIYNVAPLYQAGIDGTGQSIVVVGQTQIRLTDIQNFRSHFSLSAPNLQQVLIPRHPNPGVIPGDVDEASLDIEWSGAVARNANIVYVYSEDVWQSAIYAVDRNLGTVLTMSYGSCEPGDLVDIPTFQQYAQQANAQGMTWLAASGDNGAADCDDQAAEIAQSGSSVDIPAAIPEITAMGGTTFDDSAGGYWAASNSTSLGSALKYIPEVAWNDTLIEGGLASTGGGASTVFPRPSWQIGPGVPNDGSRHVPDVSLSSSAFHVGYYVATGGSSGFYGGTSVAAPAMAGIVALLNQYLISTGAVKQAGLGNINPALYRLAQSAPQVFHDVVSGDNMVPCAAGSPDCSGGFTGKKTGPGYDEVTGLGSVDAFNLVHQWSNFPAIRSAVVPSLDQNPVFQQAPDSKGNKWVFQLTLTEEAGIGTTLKDITIDGVSYTSQIATLFGGAAIAPGSSLQANIGLASVNAPKTVNFTFSGIDASGLTWTTSMAVPFNGAQVALKVAGAGNAASGQAVFAPGMIMSVYGTGLGSFVQTFGAVPLSSYMAGFTGYINGVPSPLYYVSPNQVNLQIPYETSPGPATLQLGNPFENVDYRFQVTAAAPGIFTLQDGSLGPFRSGARGQTLTLYVTGEGQVTPALSTGTAPNARTTAQAPKPRLPVTVTVGGQTAAVAFAGIPNGYVGVTQINYTIPQNAQLGENDVIVSIGNTPAQTVKITVTQ